MLKKILSAAAVMALAFTLPVCADGVSTQLYDASVEWANLTGDVSNISQADSNATFGYYKIDPGSGWVNTADASVRSLTTGEKDIADAKDKCLKSYSDVNYSYLGYIAAGSSSSEDKVYRYEFDFKSTSSDMTFCATTKGSTSGDLTSRGIDWTASVGFEGSDKNLNLSKDTVYHIVAVFDNVNRTATYSVNGTTMQTKDYDYDTTSITGLMIRFGQGVTISLANLDVYSSDKAVVASKVGEYSGDNDGSAATAYTAELSGTGNLSAEVTSDGVTKVFENATVISEGNVTIGMIINKANIASAIVGLN